MNTVQAIHAQAEKIAIQRGNNTLGTEHVVLAALNVLGANHPLSVAAESIGITTEALERLLDKRHPCGQPNEGPREPIIDPAAKKLITYLAEQWPDAKNEASTVFR